jgi:transcriptional regulator with XRE-family HTH domain
MSDQFKQWFISELEKHHYSQRAFAKKIGVSQPFISRVLNGETPPSVNFCHKVASALGEPPEKLLRLAGILSSVSSDNVTLDELADIVRNLPSEAQQELLDFARFKLRQNKND